MDDALLIFLDAHTGIEGWLQLSAGAIVARGPGLESLPPVADEGGARIRQVAVVPGDTVTMHWLEVPAGLAPAQAVAAAQLMAAEVSTQPLADMHVVVGPEVEERSERPVALVPALTMAGWIGALQGHRIDPDLMLPEPLLLPEPDAGFVRHDRGERPIFRGRADAFNMEPELAALVMADDPVATIDPDAFEAGLAAAIAAPPINLRQGAFAKRRRWRIDWPTVRRLAMLALAILLLTLAIQFVSILRYAYAADALEQEARAIAGRAVPGAESAADPGARLGQRLIDLRGGGAGYGAVASGLFGAINAVPNVELSRLTYNQDGSLGATVLADSPATLTALQERISGAGFAAEMAPPQMGGGRQIAELTVRAQ